MSIARLGVGFCGLVLLLAASCGTSDDSGRSYADNEGRVCTADLRATNERSVCNIEAAPTNGCATGTPCFMVHATLDIGQLQNCATCCTGTTPSFPNGLDCAPITCRTSADCPHNQPVCQGSFCFTRAKVPGGGGSGGTSPAGGAGAPAGGGTGGTVPMATAGAPTAGAGVAGQGAGGSAAAAGGSSGSPQAGSGGVFQPGGSAGAPGLPGGGSTGFPTAGASGFSTAGAAGSASGGRPGFPFGP